MVSDWLVAAGLGPGARLPAERSLAAALGLSRGELRKALAAIEAEGRITRHVGRGTFLVAPPAGPPVPAGGLAAATSPREVDEARLVLDPALARLATRAATPRQIEALREAAGQLRAAETWARYDEGDARFHRSIAEAAGSGLLLALHDLTAEIGRSLAWGRLLDRPDAPSAADPTHAEHDAIVAAIAARDPAAAADAARRHALAAASTTGG